MDRPFGAPILVFSPTRSLEHGVRVKAASSPYDPPAASPWPVLVGEFEGRLRRHLDVEVRRHVRRTDRMSAAVGRHIQEFGRILIRPTVKPDPDPIGARF